MNLNHPLAMSVIIGVSALLIMWIFYLCFRRKNQDFLWDADSVELYGGDPHRLEDDFDGVDEEDFDGDNDDDPEGLRKYIDEQFVKK